MGGSEAVRVSVSKDVFVCQECVLKAVWECVLLGDMHSGSVSEHFIPTNVVFQLPTCFQHTSCLCAYSIFYEQASLLAQLGRWRPQFKGQVSSTCMVVRL